MSESTGIHISEKVRKIDNSLINPSTAEGIQDVVVAIGGMETQQYLNNDLVNALYELTARLAFLPSIRGTLSDIRVSSTGGTVAISSLPTLGALTTLTTLVNQQQIGGMLANPQIPSMMNMTACLSNINNITVS